MTHDGRLCESLRRLPRHVLKALAFLLCSSVVTKGSLYNEGGVPLIRPEWHGGIEQLSEEPPIFIVKGLLTAAETDQIIDEYAVDLLPDFVQHANNTQSLPCRLCRKIFPVERCTNDAKDENDKCDFYTDNRHYISNLMMDVRKRISRVSGLPEDNIESSWMMNYGKECAAQGLHLDNNHHFMHPRRVVSLLIRLDDDPVGIVFPLARLREGAHPLAEDLNLIERLNKDANELPFRGSATGRLFGEGPVKKASQELCKNAPIRARKGDAVVYYQLTESGIVDIRSVHSSCPTEASSLPKMFIATWVRAESLLSTHYSLTSPNFVSDLRAWIDSRRSERGLDASVLVSSGVQENVLGITDCPSQTRTWLVQLNKEEIPQILCNFPNENNFTLRTSEESFDVYFALANTGDQVWPVGTTLSFREGSTFSTPPGILLPQVPPGQILDLSLSLRGPPAGERWYGIWSLADPNRQPFGTLLWVDAVGAASATD